ncbi:nonsense-mediated mRNA decay factor SMG7-like [Liolophura sinensis]|uniref:nonsense-mediated mRNA decay factor SMG7-like n=1 Tax=Liolophura sinensis TaxID=3198878 RepID=UPI0031598714
MSTAAQVLRQAEALKATVSDNSKNVSEVCVSRQRLEDLYKKVLLIDLEYALDKKVEQELWNHAFKNQINILQAQAKDKQNPKRTEIQATLNLFLEMASGVYLQLLQLICSTFKLDLPFRRKSSTYGIMKEWSPSKMKINPPKKSSCLYICQYCLVHLGDIARYRQQVDQAQSYYWHAAHLIPVNGQPYNQLAILEVARGNKLSTIFYYIRSLSVRHPFPATATNLEKFFSKISRERTEFKSKLSMTEFLTAFLQFHAFIHLCVELTRAAELSEKLLVSMPAHVTSQSFSWHVLVQMLAINLFAMHHVTRQTDGSPDNSPNKKDMLSEDEGRSFEIVFNFTVNTLEVLVMYTPKQEQKARNFFTMPAIRIIIDWLRLDKENFSKPVLKQSPVWPHLAKLFNIIQPAAVPSLIDSQTNNKKPDAEIALPEDFELRSFQPIEKAHSGLSFSQSVLEDRSPEVMATIRCQRLVNHGKWIAEQFPSLNLLNVKEEKPGRVHFSSATPMVKVVPVNTEQSNTPERKTVRQNVAIQAIIQKQKGNETSPERSPANESCQQTKTSKDGKSDGLSPTKYLLGTPMKDPQFMKTSGGHSSGTSQQATSPSTTTARVTFQLPAQQLSPQSQKQSIEKPPGQSGKDSKQYQSRHSDLNKPLGAQYRQMQHQQQMKQLKMQQQQQQLQALQQQQQQQLKMQEQQQQQKQQQQQHQSNMSAWPSQNQTGPQQGNYQSEGMSGPQGNPNSLTMTQRQMLMQKQFEALQKMGASPQAPPPPGQSLPPDSPASHAAMMASQQQLLNAMATLHQQQQQQQQQQQRQQQQHQQQTSPLLQQQPPPPHQQLGPRQIHPRQQHPQLGSPQSSPQQGHALQRGSVPRQQQQQSSQASFPGHMFMHQRFASARQQHPSLQFRGQGSQVLPGLGPSQGTDRQMPGKFTPNDVMNPAMFLKNYPTNFPFPFSQAAGPMANQHSANVGSPHPIGTPPGGAGLHGPGDEREMMAGIAKLSVQHSRNTPQGPSPSRLNHMDATSDSMMLNKSDGPQVTDGPRNMFKGEGGGDLVGPENAQQGTYSLFSSTPWSVQISSAGDSKSLGSSPFSSQASSMRNSPDPLSELLPGEATLGSGFNLGLGFGTGDNHWGLQGPGPDHTSQVMNSNMQVHSLWSSPGPSPLQRLLEQQRQHRQNDPH